MTPASQSTQSWLPLLGTSPTLSLPYRSYYKSGQPFALIPDSVVAHRQLAPFLPAQSLIARTFRYGLTLAPQLFSKLGKSTSLAFSPENGLVQFLTKMGGATMEQVATTPLILLGNPHGEAPRMVMLCRNAHGKPVAAVKIGKDVTARKLIQAESTFLKSAPAPIQNDIPKFLGDYSDPTILAFGMECVLGGTPRSHDFSKLPQMLHRWTSPAVPRPLNEFPAWQRLRIALQAAGIPFPKRLEAAEQIRLQPVITHGDLTPWNIKITSQGQWKVFDWERGEVVGIPGWDWFHYLIQSMILLQRWDLCQIQKSLFEILRQSDFLSYARHTKIEDITPILLWTYLIYHWQVLQPTERTDIHTALAQWAFDSTKS